MADAPGASDVTPPPRTRILVAVDGSPASLDALTFACPLAQARGADLLVAWVLDPDLAEDPVGLAADGAALRTTIEGWFTAQGLRAAYQVLLLTGAPGPALARAAADQAVDLVVVGAEGSHRESGPRFGSTANLLAHRLEVPLLAIPAGCRWRGVHEVVVGVDGSDATDAAVAAVAALPGISDAVVHAVYACQPLSEWSGAPVPTAHRQRAAHDVALWTAPLDLSGARVRREVRDEAHPSATLLRVADDVHADLVVVGAQPTSQLTGQRQGSTVFQVLQRSPRPTLLVPPTTAVGPGTA